MKLNNFYCLWKLSLSQHHVRQAHCKLGSGVPTADCDLASFYLVSY